MFVCVRACVPNTVHAAHFLRYLGALSVANVIVLHLWENKQPAFATTGIKASNICWIPRLIGSLALQQIGWSVHFLQHLCPFLFGVVFLGGGLHLAELF